MLRLLLSNLLLRGNARLKADFVKSDLASAAVCGTQEARASPGVVFTLRASRQHIPNRQSETVRVLDHQNIAGLHFAFHRFAARRGLMLSSGKITERAMQFTRVY